MEGHSHSKNQWLSISDLNPIWKMQDTMRGGCGGLGRYLSVGGAGAKTGG